MTISRSASTPSPRSALQGVLMLCMLLGIVPASWAQEPLHQDLVPVDSFVEDSSDLSTSLRQVEYGIQVPYGFEQLMQENRPDGRFVRRAAGLWAVFPRSEYMPTESGYVATWPAGTYFHIGPPRRSVVDSVAVPSTGLMERVDPGESEEGLRAESIASEAIIAQSSDGRFTTDPAEADPIDESIVSMPPPPRNEMVRVRFLSDPAYRNARLQSLVESAQAARGPSESSSK